MSKNLKKGRILIINRNKGTTLGYADVADSFFSRFRGLMLRGNLERAMILKLPKGRSKRGSGIHMFFMRIPLDVLFLDDEKKVVDRVNLKPWQTYTPINPARYVVELEEGSIKSSNTEIGDEIDFTCEQA